jgi:hypothetical protein
MSKPPTSPVAVRFVQLRRSRTRPSSTELSGERDGGEGEVEDADHRLAAGADVHAERGEDGDADPRRVPRRRAPVAVALQREHEPQHGEAREEDPERLLLPAVGDDAGESSAVEPGIGQGHDRWSGLVFRIRATRRTHQAHINEAITASSSGPTCHALRTAVSVETRARATTPPASNSRASRTPIVSERPTGNARGRAAVPTPTRSAEMNPRMVSWL